MSSLKQLSLFKVEIENRYSKENFKRIEEHINKVICEALNEVGGTVTTIAGGGSSTTSPWQDLNNNVPASSVKVIDTVALSNFKTLKYIINLSNELEAKGRTFEMTLVKQGVTIKETLGPKTGKGINYSVNANVVGSSVELSITNSEIYNIDVNYARLTL